MILYGDNFHMKHVFAIVLFWKPTGAKNFKKILVIENKIKKQMLSARKAKNLGTNDAVLTLFFKRCSCAVDEKFEIGFIEFTTL